MPASTPDHKTDHRELKAVNDGFGELMFYAHPSGWILRPKGDRWKVGQNQYEPKAQFAWFDSLDEARTFCDEHGNWPLGAAALSQHTTSEGGSSK